MLFQGCVPAVLPLPSNLRDNTVAESSDAVSVTIGTDFPMFSHALIFAGLPSILSELSAFFMILELSTPSTPNSRLFPFTIQEADFVWF